MKFYILFSFLFFSSGAFSKAPDAPSCKRTLQTAKTRTNEISLANSILNNTSLRVQKKVQEKVNHLIFKKKGSVAREADIQEIVKYVYNNATAFYNLKSISSLNPKYHNKLLHSSELLYVEIKNVLEKAGIKIVKPVTFKEKLIDTFSYSYQTSKFIAYESIKMGSRFFSNTRFRPAYSPIVFKPSIDRIEKTNFKNLSNSDYQYLYYKNFTKKIFSIIFVGQILIESYSFAKSPQEYIQDLTPEPEAVVLTEKDTRDMLSGMSDEIATVNTRLEGNVAKILALKKQLDAENAK